jgi:amino acid transporter
MIILALLYAMQSLGNAVSGDTGIVNYIYILIFYLYMGLLDRSLQCCCLTNNNQIYIYMYVCICVYRFVYMYIYVCTFTDNAAIEIIIQASNSTLACAFSWLLVVNLFFAGFASVTVTTRIMYAFSRDKGMFCSEVLSLINPTLKTPINAIIALFFIQSALVLIPLIGIYICIYIYTYI